jgi:hypothetical protein
MSKRRKSSRIHEERKKKCDGMSRRNLKKREDVLGKGSKSTAL